MMVPKDFNKKVDRRPLRVPFDPLGGEGLQGIKDL